LHNDQARHLLARKNDSARLIFVNPKSQRGSIVSNMFHDFSISEQLIMDRQITHPTKEQVRAYMLRREAERRPPPPLAEIRRQLGWCLTPAKPQGAVLQLCWLPSTLSQLGAQILLEWLCASSRVITATRTPK
jgi:hypothetical protein